MEIENSKFYDFVCGMTSIESEDKENVAWKGNFLMFEDGSVVGLASDDGKNKTHILLGTFEPNVGVSICLINKGVEPHFPVWIDAFPRANGGEDAYYGICSNETQDYGPLQVGNSLALVSELEKSTAEKNIFHRDFHLARLGIEGGNDAFVNSIINKLLYDDTTESIKLLKQLKEQFYNSGIPQEISSELLQQNS